MAKTKDLSEVLEDLMAFTQTVNVATSSILRMAAGFAIVPSIIEGLTSAINPGLMQQFTTTISNVSATLGYAFEPAIAEVITMLRQWAQQLMPLVAMLRPIFADLVSMIADLLMPTLEFTVFIFTTLVKALNPVIKLFGVLIHWLGQLMELFNAVFEVLFEMMDDFLTSIGVMDLLKEGLLVFRDVINHCVTGLVFLAAALMKLVGMTEALSKFRMNIQRRIEERKNPTGGLVAAPKDVSTGSIEDISKKASERAFAAMSGGAGARSEPELLGEILEALQLVEKVDLKEIIKSALREVKNETVPIVGKIEKRIDDISTKPFTTFKNDVQTLYDMLPNVF